MIRILTIILLIAGCGKEDKADPAPSPSRPTLAEWHSINIVKLDAFPSRADCDGLLWAGLAYASKCSLDIDIFGNGPGVWTRRPSHDCYEKGESRSSISSDSFTGLFAGSYYCGSLQRLNRVADYGEENDWLMGEPDSLISTARMSFNAKAVLGSIVERDYLKPLWTRVNEDYSKHIQSILMLLEMQATGSATTGVGADPTGNLQVYSDADPDDYLISTVKHMITDGVYDEPINMLIDEVPCPSYVRSGIDEETAERFCLAHRLFTATVILRETEKEQ